MAKKNITDEEIALIRAMLDRNMKNKDIQFYFNRPDRSVNSGRISGIRDRTYSNSASISPAPDSALDSFIAAHSQSSNNSDLGSSGQLSEGDDPLSPVRIAKCFTKGANGIWRLSVGETDRFECKANFGFKHQDKWLRPIAALANNSGGYVFFGVHDKDEVGPAGEDLSYALVGMTADDFVSADPADFATRIKAMFDPTPGFQVGTATIDGKTIGVIHVRRHDSRPVIATKAEGTIKEGDIFYRYPGQSSRIKYSDLRAMLDVRDAEARAQILPMVERLLRLGPMKTMVADLENGTLDDGNRTIQIDAALIDKLTFIKEGEFSEKEGAPTLRLVGEVHSLDSETKTKVKLGILTRDDILTAFVDQTQPDNPKEYIRFAVQVGQGERLPLHYFARQAALSKDDLVDFINATTGSPSRKKKYIEWLEPSSAFHAAVGKPKTLLGQILKGDIPQVTTPTEAAHASQAIAAIPTGAAFDKAAIFSLLKKCFETAKDTPSISFVRRGTCRLDELLFSDAKQGPT
ncbi:ATP-binding protein [Mesorhizobium sp. L2C084A000]|uniref:AlbA family DNA-binding domain-containing protein n=1 Tax=Mesorhizobium sp. L2C084A000 TaxID=1287116 RepID=UPI0003CFB525|nr:ATP-binding protein [Mesorhizobium sp. L2C084A000]ESZ20035.1 hypothetical protein X734_31780 [Mesorhizobium sp. L2C084A000]